MKFYITLWHKEGKIIFPIAFINLLFILFLFTKNDWGWIMSVPLLPIVIHLFSFDFREDIALFLQLNGVKIIDQHYAKILILFPITLLLFGNSLLILSFYQKFIFESWTDGLIFFMYFFLILGFLYQVRTPWKIAIAFLMCSLIIFAFTELVGTQNILHLLFIPGLVISHLSLYKNVIRSKF